MRKVTLPEQTLELEKLLGSYFNVIYPTENLYVVNNNHRKIHYLGFDEMQLIHFLKSAEGVTSFSFNFNTDTLLCDLKVTMNNGNTFYASSKLLIDALVDIYKQVFK